jgi:hypothetical protein
MNDGIGLVEEGVGREGKAREGKGEENGMLAGCLACGACWMGSSDGRVTCMLACIGRLRF